MAALSNKERVGRVLDLVVEGLGPWMIGLLEAKHGGSWAAEVGRTAGLTGRDGSPSPTDPAYLFWVFDKHPEGEVIAPLRGVEQLPVAAPLVAGRHERRV